MNQNQLTTHKSQQSRTKANFDAQALHDFNNWLNLKNNNIITILIQPIPHMFNIIENSRIKSIHKFNVQEFNSCNLHNLNSIHKLHKMIGN